MRTETFLNPFATTFNQVRQRLIRWQHHPTGIINQRCLPGRAWAWRVSSTGNSRALTSAPPFPKGPFPGFGLIQPGSEKPGY